MAIKRQPDPVPGGTVRLPQLDESAGALVIKTEAPGALLDGWHAVFQRSEQAPPSTAVSGRLYVIRTVDGRNMTQRLYKSQNGWSMLSTAGALEEDVDIEWVAPVRMLVPRL
jgi:hypothetical protein